MINALNSGDKSVLKTVIDGNIATDISNGKSRSEAEKVLNHHFQVLLKKNIYLLIIQSAVRLRLSLNQQAISTMKILQIGKLRLIIPRQWLKHLNQMIQAL